MLMVLMQKTVITTSMLKRPLKLTAVSLSQAMAMKSNVKFVGAVNRPGPIRCLTLANVMAQFDLFTMNASNSGSSKRWQSRRNQIKSATCGSSSSAKSARHPTPMFSSLTAIVSALLTSSYHVKRTSYGSSHWLSRRTPAAWSMLWCQTANTPNLN